MQQATALPRAWSGLATCGIAVAGVIAAWLLYPGSDASSVTLRGGVAAAAAVLAGLVALAASSRPGRWSAARLFAVALLGVGIALGGEVLAKAAGGGPSGGTPWVMLPFLGLGALALAMVRREIVEHFDRGHRPEVVADIALLTAATATIVYLVLRPDGPAEPLTVAACAVIAAVVMTVVMAWGALALWLPSPMHAGLFAAMTGMGGASAILGYRWIRVDHVPGATDVDLPIALSALAVAALLTVEPRLVPAQPARPSSRWGRPVLTAIAVAAACASLLAVHATGLGDRAGTVEASVLIGALGAAVAGRILFDQVRSARASNEVARALEQKERALAVSDRALEQLRELHGSLASSEERLRLLVDAAADGIVEIGGDGVIRRANEAFCFMIGLPPERVVGMPWVQLAEDVDEGLSLVDLPVTGRATLPRPGQDLHLEARASELPGGGRGTLLVVRDITAARTAERTIRSLLQFLQDRDEDRTRLLRRTNSAIEAERNRIARDIHDGPVQGMSAVTLSLEAVLMMLSTGDFEEASAILTNVRSELAGETESLRRLMSDLRPPLLDERGLVPALREILAKFGRESRVRTRFSSRSLVQVPPDLETLAYRIVQEALTNAGKHARATEVSVSVDAVAGQLRIEIVDNGIGFDVNRARDFLKAGRVGLASMRERTELANGSFLVHSTPGVGTTIVATMPLDLSMPRIEPALA